MFHLVKMSLFQDSWFEVHKAIVPQEIVILYAKFRPQVLGCYESEEAAWLSVP